MAKTGQYLHGRELHDHELHKLDRADRAQMTAETNFHIVTSAHSAAWENFGSKRNQTTTATAPANDENQTGLPSPSDFALSPMTTAIVGLICSPIISWGAYQIISYPGIIVGCLVGIVSLAYLCLKVKA